MGLDMHTKRARTLLAAGLVAIAASGAGVIAAVSGADSDEAPTQPLARATTAPLSPTVAAVIDRPDGVLPEFRLQPQKAKGYTLAATGTTVWIVPGADGAACIFDAQAASVCGPREQVEDKGLVLIRPPLPPREYGPALDKALRAGLEGAEADQAVREALADVKDPSGPATYLGYAPAGTTTVRLLDGEGKTIAQTTAVDGVYDFRVENFADADPRTIQIDRGEGQEPIMNGRLPAPLY